MLFNKSRAVDWMRQCGLEALITTTPASITYFSDYQCWLDPLLKEYMVTPGGASTPVQRALVVFPLEGAPSLIVSSLFAANAIPLWIKDIHVFGEAEFDNSLEPVLLDPAWSRLYELLHAPARHSSAMDALISVLHARRLTGARIGIEMEGLLPAEKEKITHGLPRAIVKDCTNLIRLIRAVKSPEEIDRLTRSAEINEEAARGSLALARPGWRIGELADRFRAIAAASGADFDHFAVGIRGLGMAMHHDHVLSDDETFYVDFGCVYRHYYSDSGFTLAMGRPRPALQDRYSALRECVSAGSAEIRPGVRASVIPTVMKRVLGSRGVTACFAHGHGLGLELRDYPILVPDNGLHIRDDCIDIPSDLMLEENMVVNLETPLFLAGAGSLHIEKSFVVTAKGSRPLVVQDREHFFHPA